MFRANYNYDSKYYIGASVRTDGLSSLPKDTRWGTFWEDQPLGVYLSKKFWSESTINDWFNDLRIRASYATIGNSDLGNYFPLSGNLRGEESRIEYSYRLEPYG